MNNKNNFNNNDPYGFGGSFGSDNGFNTNGSFNTGSGYDSNGSSYGSNDGFNSYNGSYGSDNGYNQNGSFNTGSGYNSNGGSYDSNDGFNSYNGSFGSDNGFNQNGSFNTGSGYNSNGGSYSSNDGFDPYNGYSGTGSSAYEEPMLTEIRRKHPNARMASLQDGKSTLRKNLIISIVMIAFFTIGFIASMIDAEETKDFFAHAEDTAGSVISVSSRRTGRKKHRRTVYDVSYEYMYDGTNYYDSATISLDEADNLHLVSGGSVGDPITVYVDVRDPHSSRIVYSRGVPMYYLLLFDALGVIVIIAGIDNYKWCKKGKMIIYRSGKNTIMKKIKT